jgi:hypothetical protein
MSLFNQLRAELYEKLSVELSPEPAAQTPVQVGDRFVVAFKVRNRFSPLETPGKFESAAVFRDVALTVKGTQFARIVEGDREIPVAKQILPGDSVKVEVEIEAIDRFRDIDFAPEIDIREPYIEFTVRGAFDWERFGAVEHRGRRTTQFGKQE